MIAKAVLLGILTITSYRPIASQTKPSCTSRFNCTTSIDDGITLYGVAVSQDYLKEGVIHYGDILYVSGYGYRVVNDCMGAVKHEGGKTIPIRHSIDLMVFTKDQEKKVGVRHLKVYLIKTEDL